MTAELHDFARVLRMKTGYKSETPTIPELATSMLMTNKVLPNSGTTGPLSAALPASAARFRGFPTAKFWMSELTHMVARQTLFKTGSGARDTEDACAHPVYDNHVDPCNTCGENILSSGIELSTHVNSIGWWGLLFSADHRDLQSTHVDSMGWNIGGSSITGMYEACFEITNLLH